MLVVFWGVSFAPFCVFNPAAGDFGGGGNSKELCRYFCVVFLINFKYG